MIALDIALLLLLASVSISLACVEAAFYLVRRRRLSHLSEPNPRAQLANRYLEDPPTLLMPIHIGTFTAHAGMTVVITALFLDFLAHWAMLVAFASMITYLLLFRLTVPYALVRRHPERALLWLMPAFHAYAVTLSPLVGALRKRAVEAAGDDPEEVPASSAGAEVPPSPVQESDEARLEDSLERFSETVVRDVMTPRPDIVAIAGRESVAALQRLMRESKYSRIPVFGENLDDIVGVVEVRDLLSYDGDVEASLRPLARTVFLAPATKKISDLLRELQARRTTFAVVIDEYGATAGIVSIEDIVEELVGEIKDEYDVEAEPITVEADGAVLVSGRLSVDRLEQALETRLDDGDVGTVGGLVTAVFGRIPQAGEHIERRGFRVEVVDAERKRVNRVRFRRAPQPPADN